jgi:hypothetical protein
MSVKRPLKGDTTYVPPPDDNFLWYKADNERLKDENAEWQARAATWLASPEAAKRLEGYRELGEQLAQAEAEIERLKAVNEALRALLQEIYDWTSHKGTAWALKAKAFLQGVQS